MNGFTSGYIKESCFFLSQSHELFKICNSYENVFAKFVCYLIVKLVLHMLLVLCVNLYYLIGRDFCLP